MKTLKVKSTENFRVSIETSIISNHTELSSSSIPMSFWDNAGLKQAKFFVQSHNWHDPVLSFTGKLDVDGERLNCIGYSYHDGTTEDIWISIIESPKSIPVEVSRSQFIKNVKKYYELESIPYDDDGNIRGEMGIFRNSALCSTKIIEGALVYPELSNDLFPIMRGDILEFGEYIKENLVRIHSREEWNLRTAMRIDILLN